MSTFVARLNDSLPARAVCLLVTSGCLLAGPANAVSQEWTIDLVDVTDEVPADHHRAESVVFLPHSRAIATAGWFHDSVAQTTTGEIRVFNVDTGRVERVISGTCDHYAMRGGMLDVAPRGGLIAAAGSRFDGDEREHRIEVFDFASGRPVSTFPARHVRNPIAFTSDGRHMVSASDAHATVEFIEARTGNVIRTQQAGNTGVWWIALGPRDEFFVTGDADETISAWNSQSGVRLGTITHVAAGAPVGLSPDGSLLAAGGFRPEPSPQTVALWQVEQHFARPGAPRVEIRKLDELTGHTAGIYSVAFSLDGKLLASASQDTTCRVWDIATRKSVATFEHNDFVYDVAFSPDGQHLATLGRDALKCWRVDTLAEDAQR